MRIKQNTKILHYAMNMVLIFDGVSKYVTYKVTKKLELLTLLTKMAGVVHTCSNNRI